MWRWMTSSFINKSLLYLILINEWPSSCNLKNCTTITTMFERILGETWWKKRIKVAEMRLDDMIDIEKSVALCFILTPHWTLIGGRSWTKHWMPTSYRHSKNCKVQKVHIRPCIVDTTATLVTKSNNVRHWKIRLKSSYKSTTCTNSFKVWIKAHKDPHKGSWAFKNKRSRGN